MKEAYGNGIIIDFKTVVWHLGYRPFDLTHYRVSYIASARLINLEKSKIIWQGDCGNPREDSKTKPTWNDLNADKGSILKAMLDEAANACAEDLMSQFSGKQY